MKFQVRDGFVVKTVNIIDLGDGKVDRQENTTFGGQRLELTAAEAEQHTHKLEGLDKESKAFLDAKVLPVAPGAALGISAETMALVQAMAAETAKAIVAAMQAPATPSPEAPAAGA